MRLAGLAFGCVVVTGLGAGSGWGQTVSTGATASVTGPVTVEAALHTMSDRAAVVFVGTVTAVRRVGVDPESTAGGVVEIDFAVEQGVRGVATGGTYTLREWAGRWAGMDVRYRVGQRMFLMLHAPGASGLSSPVGGADGAMPVRGGGGTVGQKDRGKGAAATTVDLRWVGARVSRPVVYRKETPRSPGGTAAGDGGTSSASVAAQEAAVSSMVSLVGSWKAVSRATR